MSKKQHDYYYSYTSPPTSSSQEGSTTPSAPSIEQVGGPSSSSALPSYQDAIVSDPSSPPMPIHVSELDGFVRDTSIPPFNPYHSPPSAQAPLPEGAIYNTGDYDGQQHHCDQEQPLLGGGAVQAQAGDRFFGRPPPPGYSIYTAKYETKKKGILSRDVHLNQDGEALAQFLQQHNTPPRMKIKFHGYHEETYYRSRNVRDEDGNWREEREPVTKTIDDFVFYTDCSNDISPECRGIYVMPDPKTGEIKAVRDLCDEYVRSPSQLKELRLNKVIEWDYTQLTRAFTTAIRQHGYHHSVSISFEMENYRVYVKSNSTMSRLADHKAIRFLFFITCLWVLAWPLLVIFRQQFGHRTLKSEWKMTVTEQQWFERHLREVLAQINPTARFGNAPFLL
ncbi:hypothetical protein BC940DRAFT_329140 [Gongronella butleri]|nr:hypothetical protein BC940DRAFT_329140 [Gongronella butleri]